MTTKTTVELLVRTLTAAAKVFDSFAGLDPSEQSFALMVRTSREVSANIRTAVAEIEEIVGLEAKR